MGYTDQRLFRARALEPITDLGSVIYLTDQSGPLQTYDSPYAVVAGIEPVSGLGPHGEILIWSQGAAAPAGYGTAVGGTGLITGAATGTITAGSFVDIANPPILQQGKKQLFHMRFAMRPTALTGINAHDLELQVYLPGSLAKFGILQASPGFFNMVDAIQDPADAVVAPAQGSAQALPAVYPAMHPRDSANLTEMFIFEINGPRFRLWNNGSASVTAGTVGLRIWGFRYDLQFLTPDNTWGQQWVYGRARPAPPVNRPIIVVPTAPYGATGSY